jgi:putative membrane protein
MVSYNPKSWLYLLTHSYSRYVIRTLWPALIFMVLYAGAICFLFLVVLKVSDEDFHSTTAMHSLLGIVLGLFLVFRTNTAYDRWWEGRKLWGTLVNNTRNLALKLNGFLPQANTGERFWFAEMIPNLVAAIRDHLRDKRQVEKLESKDATLVAALAHFQHVPNGVLALLYQRVNDLYKNQQLSGDQLLLVDRELKEFSDVCGACERIKNTPIPYSYSMYIKKFIFIYLLTLPFGFVTEMHYWTIPIVFLISFVLLSVELIAEEIEEPFGEDGNDLPTDELTAKIRENVREILLAKLHENSVKNN